jgi:hypothetical protein
MIALSSRAIEYHAYLMGFYPAKRIISTNNDLRDDVSLTGCLPLFPKEEHITIEVFSR